MDNEEVSRKQENEKQRIRHCVFVVREHQQRRMVDVEKEYKDKPEALFKLALEIEKKKKEEGVKISQKPIVKQHELTVEEKFEECLQKINIPEKYHEKACKQFRRLIYVLRTSYYKTIDLEGLESIKMDPSGKKVIIVMWKFGETDSNECPVCHKKNKPAQLDRHVNIKFRLSLTNQLISADCRLTRKRIPMIEENSSEDDEDLKLKTFQYTTQIKHFYKIVMMYHYRSLIEAKIREKGDNNVLSSVLNKELTYPNFSLVPSNKLKSYQDIAGLVQDRYVPGLNLFQQFLSWYVSWHGRKPLCGIKHFMKVTESVLQRKSSDSVVEQAWDICDLNTMNLVSLGIKNEIVTKLVKLLELE